MLVPAGSSGFAAAASGPSAAACNLNPTGGTVTRSLFPASFRSYNLRVPSGLSNPAPLLLSLHGLGSFPFGQEQATGWSSYADQEKFIVAYLAGESNTWNANRGSADVKFLRDVVNHIAASYCVDPKRVYVEGGSMGSFMAQRVACDAADKFAAASGFMGGEITVFGSCSPSRPIAFSLFHGESDNTIPLAAGQQARDEWVKRDACNPTPIVETVSDGTAQRYGGCGGGVSVTWRTYRGLGPRLPDGHAGHRLA